VVDRLRPDFAKERADQLYFRDVTFPPVQR